MATYRLELTRHAEDILRKITRSRPEIGRRLAGALDAIEADPHSGKALKGSLSGRYSWRVGDHRIVYSIRDAVLLVIVIDIGNRRDIYR